MFTGLIQILGTVRSLDNNMLVISVPDPGFLKDMKPGDSISVNGACLSVTKLEPSAFQVFVTGETSGLTNIPLLKKNSRINLEKPLKLQDRMHGHLVQGHVDATGLVEELHRQAGNWVLKVKYPASLDRYIILKGSVAVNGISLTVAKKYGLIFECAIIPETIERTNLGTLRAGEKVNLEADMLAKYVESMLNAKGK